jgi:hypothetical protein
MVAAGLAARLFGNLLAFWLICCGEVTVELAA